MVDDESKQVVREDEFQWAQDDQQSVAPALYKLSRWLSPGFGADRITSGSDGICPTVPTIGRRNEVA